MRIRPLPKNWLIHTIDYEQYMGMDDFGGDAYEEQVTIEHVRVDLTTVSSRDGMQNTIVANGVVFIDAIHSEPLAPFTERSRIIFNECEYIVTKVVPCYHPQSNEVHHWELEVL